MKFRLRVPAPLKPYTREMRAFLRWLPHLGFARRCPICGRGSRSFASSGRSPRPQARCRYCNSLERHRLVWLWFQQQPGSFRSEGMRLLHVAPETCLAPLLRRKVGVGYLSADLLDPTAMERIDICDIQHRDNSFDAIYCSHVLEHVPDDRKAMREFRRVLREDGWAVLLVPITAEKTFEDATITDPEDRLRLFGQEDHVRRYGLDYVDRLREAGFEVQIFHPTDLFSPREIERYGLGSAAGAIFLCTCAGGGMDGQGK